MKKRILFCFFAFLLSWNASNAVDVNDAEQLVLAIFSSPSDINFTTSAIIFSSSVNNINVSGKETVFGGSSVSFYGGNLYAAFDISASSITFTNSVNFNNFKNASSGGALVLNNGSTLNFSGSTVSFKNNASENFGGAVAVYNQSRLSIDADYIEFSS
ncbi:MAG: hypothetical protein LBU09_04715, partial [Endomicrobium sp.]|nr:hypothetical protein [Endomicrobium sp.]